MQVIVRLRLCYMLSDPVLVPWARTVERELRPMSPSSKIFLRRNRALEATSVHEDRQHLRDRDHAQQDSTVLLSRMRTYVHAVRCVQMSRISSRDPALRERTTRSVSKATALCAHLDTCALAGEC